jgi:hypothetical protein
MSRNYVPILLLSVLMGKDDVPQADTKSALSRLRATSYSHTLPTTLSAWLRNMDKLSALIDRLSEIATTAPQEHHSQLIHQVDALRIDFNKQRNRYAAFLRLAKKYADRFLSDISEEIQQQSCLLDALEKKLDMAKSLRQEVVQLYKSYEVGTLDSIKKVRRTGVYPPRYMPFL